MQLKYRVHSAIITQASKKVKFEGAWVDANLTTLEVELECSAEQSRPHGSMTLRFLGNEEIAEAQKMFVVDHEVMLTFSPAE